MREIKKEKKKILGAKKTHTKKNFSLSLSLSLSNSIFPAPKYSPFLNVSSAGTITVSEALNYPGPANATRFESGWLSKLRTRGANVRTALLEQDHVMRVAEAVFRAVSNPINNGIMLRIAFHECGTFDYRGPPGRKGGCNGSIRYEFDWTSNGGIQRFGYPFMWTGREIANAILGAGTISFADAAVIIGAAGVANAGGPWVNGESRLFFFHFFLLLLERQSGEKKNCFFHSKPLTTHNPSLSPQTFFLQWVTAAPTSRRRTSRRA